MLGALDLHVPSLAADVCHLKIVDHHQNQMVYQTPFPGRTALRPVLETRAHL